MIVNVERREGVSFRVAGRTLSGRALVYGDVSPDFNERFESGAFGEVRTVPVNLQHDPRLVVSEAATLIDSARSLDVRADLPEGSAALALVRRGALTGFSIEFHSKAERREAGIRVVERAELTGLALVDKGAYPQSKAEVRARSGRTIRARIPSGKNLGCRCSGAACKFARFAQGALDEAIAEGFKEGIEDVILASYGNYQTPLASTARGTVRAKMVRGDALVEIDLPIGAEGDQVLRAAENAGVVIRPFLDADRSVGVIESVRAAGDPANTMVYSKVRIRALIISATDEREGWPEPEIVDTPGMSAPRAAPEARRRLWL